MDTDNDGYARPSSAARATHVPAGSGLVLATPKTPTARRAGLPHPDAVRVWWDGQVAAGLMGRGARPYDALPDKSDALGSFLLNHHNPTGEQWVPRKTAVRQGSPSALTAPVVKAKGKRASGKGK